jgi:hypothetical protein
MHFSFWWPYSVQLFPHYVNVSTSLWISANGSLQMFPGESPGSDLPPHLAGKGYEAISALSKESKFPVSAGDAHPGIAGRAPVQATFNMLMAAPIT